MHGPAAFKANSNRNRAADRVFMIIVLGEILFDKFPGYSRIGGAPFNFAFHLRQLGFDAAFVSRVGQDALGEEILSFVNEKGFDPGHIQVDPGHATGTVDITVNRDGDHRFFIVPDRAYDHLEWTDSLKLLCAEGPDMVYFGTLIQRTAKGEAMVKKVLSGAGKKALRFCDINLRPDCWTPAVVEACVKNSDILKLNTDELEILAPDPEKDDVPRALHLLAANTASRKGPGLVILTRGEKGAVWVTQKKVLDCPVNEKNSVQVADTVGAGDAYAAIAAAGRLAGICDRETMAMAQEFAAKICTVQGAIPEDTALYQPYKKRLQP